MNFLPVAERELRTASRRHSIFRLRWWTTLLALGISFGGLGMMSISASGRRMGNPLFSVLTGYALLLCLISGVLLTADSLAREKREGTLGLLFLTNLTGVDIVLGKLFGQSLGAIYSLLALLPATALPVLIGGVGGLELARVALALLNALFLSMALGTCVSAFSLESHKAFGNSIALLIAVTVILPVLAHGLNSMYSSAWFQSLGWLSPATAYSFASENRYGSRPGTFWGSLGLAHAFGWALLAFSGAWLGRACKDKPLRIATRPKPAVVRWKQTFVERSRERMTENPVCWLRSRDLQKPWIAWAVVLLWGLTAVIILIIAGRSEAPMLIMQSALPFGFVLKLLFAAQSTRFFAEARRNGTLELLLCTPLSSRQIVQGQMRSVLEAYAGPFIGMTVILLLSFVWRFSTGLFTLGVSSLYNSVGVSFLAVVFLVRTAADIFAVLWFGTALALTSKRPNLATMWTVLFVLLLPAPLSFCWVDILIDLVLISWGTNKCRLDLRRLVTEEYDHRPQRVFSFQNAAAAP